MHSIRIAVLALFAMVVMPLASAFGFEAYSKESFATLLKGSKPLIVHVHADW
jgi:hypothetical protein